MDDNQINQNPTLNNSNLATELAQVTQEMYKKNFELVERNKTLSLLRKINEIILSSVTDVYKIAQQVADLVVVEAEFKAVIIMHLDRKNKRLLKLASSQTQETARVEFELKKQFFMGAIPLSQTQNQIVRSITGNSVLVSHHLMDILDPYYTEEEIEKVKQITGIQSSIIYPLTVREQIMGAMVICIGQSEEALFQYQKDLMDRLSGIVGIAIDNAILYEETQKSNETLKQLDKLKDEFVSLTSHELKTPMTAIKSYLWLATTGKTIDPQKQKYYLDRAYKSTERLISMVNNMLNVSRIEAGRIIVTLKSVKLDILINDVIAELLPRSQELGVIINYAPLPSLPEVLADADKIKEVLINLIGNSLKFTPKGGKITITTTLENNMIVTKVSDNGKGIAPENMAKLFQKFSTSNANHLVKQNTDGTGLGLYICKSLIEMHGGKIWATSDGVGKGSSFYFSLKIFTRLQEASDGTAVSKDKGLLL